MQTQFGWHVILLEDKRVAERPSFEDAEPQLTAAIQRSKLGEQIIELRKTTKLELNEDLIKLKKEPAKPAPARSNPVPLGPALGPGPPLSPHLNRQPDDDNSPDLQTRQYQLEYAYVLN